MEKIFHWTNTFKTLGENDDGSVNIRGLASTNSLDRTGDVINHDAWTKSEGLAGFQQNPIILFNHNYNKPIGRATSIEVSKEGLELGAKISKSAGEIKDLIKDGVLGAFSVGFRVKDAEYKEETDGFEIKDAELFEVSVVSVPANQTAMFSLAKSFDSTDEYQEFKNLFINNKEANQSDKIETPQATGKTVSQEKPMSTDNEAPSASVDLKAYAEEVATKTAAKFAMAQAEKDAKEQAQVNAAAAEAAAVEAEQEKVKAIVEVGMEGAERLTKDLEERVSEKHEDLEKVVEELRVDLTEKKAEIEAIRESKRIFGREDPNWQKAYESDINDAWTMGLATGKGWDTKLGQSTIEKVNAHSGVGVSSADFEQTVSTNVERDIQLALVLAPLFREIPMSSATQIIPILPDSGYAEFASAQTATGSSPHGNLAERGDTYGSAYGGIDMTERTLSTKKLISQSYLGNETEEDAILPILPLIRESIVRSHARAVENAVLLGNNADGAFGTGGASFDGLWTLAEADSDVTQSSTAFASDSVTAAELLALRKNMGKYGINASDIFYCVSSTAYFNLLEDAEFQDVNLVGSAATKLNGEIGSVFGSKIIVCDEFPTAAVNMPAAIAVWPRNYVMPRLRGMTIESDYEVANQRRVLVASQRIGFTDMIDGATSKWAYQYKGS
ncbi:MAG: HK97 family phage prohead protease [Candidatus Pacebacteria bacterium]|nr:HK97 family phage prohead protease [Candidatus Paceibacterota bacterium]